MSKFNTSIQKLNELWQQVEENSNQKKIKNNDDKFTFFINLLKQQNIKIPLQIFDSGDINLIPSTTNDASTALKSEKMPSSISYSENIDINLPEILLPFVKYSIEIKSIPDTEIHGVFEYDPSTWTGDSIEIRGDGQLIYKSNNLPNANGTIGGNAERVFSDSFFLTNGISIDLSKKVWKGTIIKNDDSIKENNVKQLITTVITSVGAGNCVGNDSEEIFEVTNLTTPEHEIISLTSTSFTAIGDLTVRTWNDTGSSCDLNTVVTQNVEKTFIFDNVDSYVITLSDGLNINSSDIKSQEFERNNNWLFWSALKQRLFQLVLFGQDGNFKELNISNLPNTNVGDTLPYTNITIKRNVEFTTPIPIIQKQSEGAFHEPSLKNLARTGREFKNYIKLSSSEAEIPIYRFNLEGSFLIIAPATIKRFDTRTKSNIVSQEFKSLGSNDWNVQIDKGESSFISGTVANILHIKETVGGSVITEFFTDPNNNPRHGIISLSETEFTAVGDETVTIIPFDPELPPVITTRNNIIATKNFADSTTYSIGIIDGVDFPIYNDIYTVVGTTYDLTTENHGILPKDIWIPSTDELTLNIKAHLVNPLYWREERKYNKNDF